MGTIRSARVRVSIRASFVFILSTGLGLSCASGEGGRDSKSEKPVQKGPRILALGDSYTIGQSVKVSERWPVQLTLLLRRQGLSIAEPEIIARTGWTTDELATGIKKADPKGPFRLVTLLIGVNNQFRKRSEEEFEKQFASLLKRAIALAGNKKESVLVVSIPDYGVTDFGRSRGPAAIAKAIDRFNAIKKKVAGKEGVLFLDVTAISRKAATDGSLVADDGLHPSAKMYDQWARHILPHALKIFKKD